MSGIFRIIIPLLILGGGAFVIYLAARLFQLRNRVEALLTIIVLVIAMVSLIFQYIDIPGLVSEPSASFGVSAPGGILYRINPAGVVILTTACVMGILISLYSGEYLSKDPRYLLYYPLILLTLAGLLGMFLSNNLFNLFLLTELTTVAASALIAFRFQKEVAIKAGYKYLIMSSLGTMIMLLGIYFVYRSTGEMHIDRVLASPDNFTRIGAACFLLGFSVKAGVVPLHTWVPDVYGYAPSAVSGLLAGVVSKSMLFIMPVICLRLGMTRVELGAYLMIFACFNMLIGSVRMLKQRMLRRFLSFSSIAQTGYLMFGLGIGFYYDLPQAFSAGLFLFLVIAVMKTLAFLSAGVFQFYTGSQDIDRLRGIGYRMPVVALSFSIALAGLGGIPLLAGFTGKWLIFSAALAAGDFFAIICLGVFLTSTLIGLGGYLPLLVSQYLSPEMGEEITQRSHAEIMVSKWMLTPIAVLTILVFLIGVFPGPWLSVVDYVMQWMLI